MSKAQWYDRYAKPPKYLHDEFLRCNWASLAYTTHKEICDDSPTEPEMQIDPVLMNISNDRQSTSESDSNIFAMKPKPGSSCKENAPRPQNNAAVEPGPTVTAPAEKSPLQNPGNIMKSLHPEVNIDRILKECACEERGRSS
ncbi:hypothetical protein JB92DRAFT_3136937 [Gautieria morchelliformis]|nr:hypothetical protein JB92DRAFT_3136937 [Gautieria morchelliformis]